MKSSLPPFIAVIGRRALALLGALGMLGMAAPSHAAPTPERAALEARVAEMRRHLNDSAELKTSSAAPTLLAQAAKWNNWPNWSNWANWRNA